MAYPIHLDEKTLRSVLMTRSIGKQFLRPLGIEADRQGHPHPPDHPFYQQVASMGFMERNLPKARPGDGPRRSARGAVAVLEEASYWDRGMAVSLPGPGLGAATVATIGTEAQGERWLARFRDRSKPRWAAFAMTEPQAGSDVARITTRCTKVGDRWVLNGAKAFCSNSPRADWIVVYATVDPGRGRAGHRAFVVERGTKGMGPFRLEKKMGLVAYETASFPLEDCEVPAENLLGGGAAYVERAGFRSAMKTFDASRPAIAAMAVGIGRAAWDLASESLKEHFELGRPIARYRRLEEKLRTAKRGLDTARLMCWKAAWLADMARPNTLQASMAKVVAPQAAMQACRLAMEVLGAAGIARDAGVEKLFRDVKAMDIVEGTGQIQRLVIARRIVDYPREGR